MKTFQNKTVFLTGAASGIGRELALQLAELDCHLYLVDVASDGLNRLVSDIGERTQHTWSSVCDLSKPEQVAATLKEFDQQADVIDIVINNAGVAYYGPTESMTSQQWDWLMNINLLAPIQITNHFLPQLMTRPEAHIANMCSIAGLVAGGRFSAYHTSKFGMIGFTEALRAEYGRKGIGVSAICPGPVLTKLYDAAASSSKDRKVPSPPAWASTSPERVAKLTINAMRKNKRQVLITPMAHGLASLKRLMPGVIDFANQVSRKKRKRLAELQRLEEERLAGVSRDDDSRQTERRAA